MSDLETEVVRRAGGNALVVWQVLRDYGASTDKATLLALANRQRQRRIANGPSLTKHDVIVALQRLWAYEHVTRSRGDHGSVLWTYKRWAPPAETTHPTTQAA